VKIDKKLKMKMKKVLVNWKLQKIGKKEERLYYNIWSLVSVLCSRFNSCLH
jgi:hypothetical protein